MLGTVLTDASIPPPLTLKGSVCTHWLAASFEQNSVPNSVPGPFSSQLGSLFSPLLTQLTPGQSGQTWLAMDDKCILKV